MIAKLTSKNQLTLPKAVIQQMATHVDEIDYFSVVYESGKIVLTPVQVNAQASAQSNNAELVRNKLEALGINENDVADAISWSRHKQ